MSVGSELGGDEVRTASARTVVSASWWMRTEPSSRGRMPGRRAAGRGDGGKSGRSGGFPGWVLGCSRRKEIVPLPGLDEMHMSLPLLLVSEQTRPLR